MKKVLIYIALFILIVTAGIYLYLRYNVLKTEDYKPDPAQAKNFLDLRPSIIAKLRQIVKDGSDDLYRLEIGSLEPDLVTGTLVAGDLLVSADSATLQLMDSLETAPDETFKITITRLNIDGLGLNDLLAGKSINLKSVMIKNPQIEVFRQVRTYNKEKRQAADTVSLYSKIYKELKHFSADTITILNASIISKDHSKPGAAAIYENVDIRLEGMLVDSSTQYDRKRFLFAENARFSMKDFSARTADSLYIFTCKSLEVSAPRQQLVATGVALTPRFGKDQFQVKTGNRKDRMDIKVPKVVLSGIDWWALANKEKLVAGVADIYECSLKDYIDKSRPEKKFILNSYPHQAIMKIPLDLLIGKINLHNMELEYEEYNPNSGSSGVLSFSKINGSILNVTNLPTGKDNRYMDLKVKAMFMKQVPADITFRFDHQQVKQGSFTAEVSAETMDSSLLNTLTQPLALINLKRGLVKEVRTSMKGDNRSVHADFKLLYEDLYIVPLEKENEKGDALRKKKFTAFLANFILIKKSNPSGNDKPRTFSYSINRERYPSFFTVVWKAILKGIIETIGAPARLAK